MPESQFNPSRNPLPDGRAILVIDTVSRPGYVALCIQAGVPPRQRSFTHFRRQSEELFPSLQALLHDSALALGHLRAVAVATGPGSFSAMRVGLTGAKSLAETAGLPLVGISLLDAASDHCPNEDRLILLPASRNQWFAAAYDAANSPVSQPQVIALEELAALEKIAPSLSPHGLAPTKIISTGDLSVIDQLRTQKLNYRIEDCGPHMAAYFMHRVWARVHADDWDNPLTLDALYLRREDADGQWTDRSEQRRPISLVDTDSSH